MLFFGHGAVVYTGEQGELRFILDSEFLRDVASGSVLADVS